MVRVSADIGNGDAAVCDSDRELHMQAGPRPARAVERDPAADGLHAVFEAGQAPVLRVCRRAGRNRATEPSGAATIPANNIA